MTTATQNQTAAAQTTVSKVDALAVKDATTVAVATGKLGATILGVFAHAQSKFANEFARYSGEFARALEIQCALQGVSHETPKRIARQLANAVADGVNLSEHASLAAVYAAHEQKRKDHEAAIAAGKDAHAQALAAKAASGDIQALAALDLQAKQAQQKALEQKAREQKQAVDRLEEAAKAAKEIGVDVGAIVAPVSHASEAWDSLLKRAAIAARTAGIDPDQFITLAEQAIGAE